MSESMNRRHFLGAASSSLAVGLAGGAAGSAQDKLIVGVMGTGGRGTALAKSFAREANVEVAYVCDVDDKRVQNAAAEVEKAAGKAPKTVPDFRRILDDKDVNILVVATCNHWHAPAAILGCAAGKHVYVEKPCSHNPREGELLVEAAHKHDRRVQMGNQRRSWPMVQDAIAQLHAGVIGRPYFAQAWYHSVRPSIGKGQPAAAPGGLDYDLWQGPAPRRPFHTNYLHYNWHWFWHWGNGELGNNGVHTLDLCRWGLGVDFPTHVVSAGGRYRYDDDQETPDTHVVSFDFADRKSITWEGFSCNAAPSTKQFDIVFYGDNGTLGLSDSGYAIFDVKGKELGKTSGSGSDAAHFRNFLEAVRGGVKLNSPIDEGHKSTLLCHLGNIAQRTGKALRCEPQTGRILDDKQAITLWSREYAAGWEPKV